MSSELMVPPTRPEIQIGQGVAIKETFPGMEGVVLETPDGDYPYYLVFVTKGGMKGKACYCLEFELKQLNCKISIDQASWLLEIATRLH